jgi:hypothetical protein
MTRWILRLALLGGVIIAGIWGWRVLFPGPEQIIRKRLTQLTETASSTGNEGALAKLAHAQKLASFFTPNVEITVDLPGQYSQKINGTDELMQAAAAARSLGSPVKIELLDVTIVLGPDLQTAEAHMTGKATVPGDRTPQVQELKVRLKKVEGQWLIDHAETVRTLR